MHIFDIRGNFVILKQNDHINKPTDRNCLNENCRYILICLENVNNYFHDFRRPVKNATMKIRIVIKNGWSFKLHQTGQVNTSHLSTTSIELTTDEHYTACQWAVRIVRSGREGRGVCREDNERQEGHQVSRSAGQQNHHHSPYHLTPHLFSVA